MRELKIEEIDINKIKKYSNNCKLHPREQLEQIKKSITEYGYNDLICIDENNTLIEGEGRLVSLTELGYKKIQVVRLSGLSEEQKRAYILVHNKICLNSDFDIDILDKELDFLDISGIDMSSYGFDLDLDLDEELEEEDEFEDKPEVLKYNLIFGCEEEQETFLRFVEYLKEKYPDLDTITSRLYAYINEYI